jgi:hypothetical protein
MSFLSPRIEGAALPDLAELDAATVSLAVNGCTPWVSEALHGRGHWEALAPTLDLAAARRAAGTIQDLRLTTRVTADNFHELPALAALAERLGADALVIEMADGDVAAEDHPLHLALLETLRHPRLRTPLVEGDLPAVPASLPSDALGRVYSREQLQAAIDAARPQAEIRVALCAAGRIRFAEDESLLQMEAQALYELGFAPQARFRLFDCVAMGGEAIAIC